MNKNFNRALSAPSFSSVAIVAGGILLLAAFRVLRATWLPELPNFSPFAAVAFCGGFFLPGVIGWALPIGALFLSDLLLNLFLGYEIIGSGQMAAWGSMIFIVALSRVIAASGKFSYPMFFTGVFASSLGFYAITNAVCWLTNPDYPRGLAGLWMSLTTGLPGFPPSWVFFRNSLGSDFLFAALILTAWNLARSRQGACLQSAQR